MGTGFESRRVLDPRQQNAFDLRAVGRDPTGRTLVVRTLAAMMGIIVTFEVLRHLVAPSFTEVVHGSPGLGEVEGTCLQR